VAAFSTDLSCVDAVVCRIYELSRSLPDAPLDRYMEKTRALPATTEAERLVLQRVGLNVFREALMDCASDAKRLDPYNGLLLSANARSLLSPSGYPALRIPNLKAVHPPFLRHHREYVWKR
jgi:hypothetical protein